MLANVPGVEADNGGFIATSGTAAAAAGAGVTRGCTGCAGRGGGTESEDGTASPVWVSILPLEMKRDDMTDCGYHWFS